MAGTFEGLSDLEWKLFADLFPPEPTEAGAWHAAHPLSSGREYLAQHPDYRLPLVSSPARSVMGVQERGASVAAALAGRSDACACKGACSGWLRNDG